MCDARFEALLLDRFKKKVADPELDALDACVAKLRSLVRLQKAIVDSAAPAARGACLASAPGAWRARVCIAFIIMVVSWAVSVLVGL